MELTLDHSFILNMYKLMSVPNRNLIRWLLIHNCVSCSELHFKLMKIFHLGQIFIQYSSFSYAFNCLLTSYLKSVVKASSEFSNLKPIMSYSANLEYNLTDIFLREPMEIDCIFIKGIDVPIQIINTNSDDVKIVQDTENCDRKGNFIVDCDFHSFLIPLEQDYTKSSKGYRSYITTYDKVKDKSIYSVFNEKKNLQINNVSYSEINITPKGCEVIYKEVQEDELKSKNSDSNVIDSDVISYDKDFSSRQQISIQEKCSRNAYSKSNFNYSLGTFSDKVNQIDCTVVKNVYDSDDSVIFSENSILKEEKWDTKIVLYNSATNCLDADVFSKNSEKQENEIINKFQDYINLDTSFEVFSNWDDDYDENDPDLLEKFNLEFSCSQNKMLVNPLSTYGYDNACFEDDNDNDLFSFNFIGDINKNWNNSMKDVSNEPRVAKRVSFVPLPDLVSVETFEPDNDGYCYSLYVFDQVHFQNRIQEFEAVIKPYLTSEHRAKVFYQNYQHENNLF